MATVLFLLFVGVVWIMRGMPAGQDAMVAYPAAYAGLAFLYIFPLLLGTARQHHQLPAIAVLNMLLGWTFLGWVAALVWACTATDGRRRARGDGR